MKLDTPFITTGDLITNVSTSARLMLRRRVFVCVFTRARNNAVFSKFRKLHARVCNGVYPREGSSGRPGRLFGFTPFKRNCNISCVMVMTSFTNTVMRSYCSTINTGFRVAPCDALHPFLQLLPFVPRVPFFASCGDPYKVNILSLAAVSNSFFKVPLSQLSKFAAANASYNEGGFAYTEWTK